jgi:hypothetical protein
MLLAKAGSLRGNCPSSGGMLWEISILFKPKALSWDQLLIFDGNMPSVFQTWQKTTTQQGAGQEVM